MLHTVKTMILFFRLMTAIEQGLISYWLENVPNFTVCDNIPKKKMVTSYIFLSDIWVRKLSKAYVFHNIDR